MKTTNQRWKLLLTLLLAGAAGTIWAVTSDLVGPCWRDSSNSTRQVWVFGTNSNPAAPDTKVNQPGNPTALLTVGALGHGWYNTTCADGLGGCGPVALALLPTVKNCSGGTKYRNSSNACVATYTDPPTLGTAQGYWDMGGTNGKVVLTIPNTGAPAGTIRKFYIQGTFIVGDVGQLPLRIGVTNSGGVGRDNDPFNTGGNVADTQVEQPLNGSSLLAPNSWYNRRIILTNAATTAAGTDTITIDNPAFPPEPPDPPADPFPFWVDALIVETLDRVAQNDSLTGTPSVATNIPFAQLLANDRGGNLVAVGGAVNGSVTTNAGNVVTFTPTAAGAASFWYTNSDCDGIVLSAQVTLTVAAANNPPVANPDNYTRPKGAALKIKISDLATNDTDVDLNALTVTGLSLTTTNGVQLSTNGNLITYTNSATLDANDRFTYTVSDGQGGTATGTVILTVTGGQTGQTSGSITVTGGVVNLVFHGIPGGVYQVQRSTNAGSTWLTFSTNTANGTGTPPVGQINVTDNFSGVVPIPSSAVYRLFLP